jgi:hypothetical protein
LEGLPSQTAIIGIRPNEQIAEQTRRHRGSRQKQMALDQQNDLKIAISSPS